MPRRGRALTLQDQRKLAALASRPDIPIRMEATVWFFKKIYERREFLWECIERHLEAPDPKAKIDVADVRAREVQVRLLEAILGKVLPTQREVTDDRGAQTPSTAVAIKIVGVNRGTRRARQDAIEVTAQKREALPANG